MRNLENNYPKAFDDIIIQQLYEGDESKYILGSPTNDRYITGNKRNCEIFYLLLNDLDGKKSVESIALKWNRSIKETETIIDMFFKKGLLIGSSNDNDISEVRKLSIRLLSIKCSHLEKINKRCAGIILNTSFLILIAMLIFNMYHLCNNELSGVSLFTYDGSYIKGLILSSLIMVPSFLFHELYHSFIALKYGLKPSKIDMCLYLLFFPLFYVKIKGMYTTSSRNRIKILCGGYFANFILANMSLMLFFMTKHNIFLTIVLAQLNIIIVNCNPFNLTDGYFIGTQLLKTINLRPKLFKLLANFRSNILKVDKTLIIYAIVNCVIIFINIIYFSNYSLRLFSEVLNVRVSTGIIIGYNIVTLLLYYLIIVFRYKEKKDGNQG